MPILLHIFPCVPVLVFQGRLPAAFQLSLLGLHLNPPAPHQTLNVVRYSWPLLSWLYSLCLVLERKSHNTTTTTTTTENNPGVSCNLGKMSVQWCVTKKASGGGWRPLKFLLVSGINWPPVGQSTPLKILLQYIFPLWTVFRQQNNHFPRVSPFKVGNVKSQWG